MKIIRVFPRKTSATPTDDLVRFTIPLRKDEADEIHISVTFTYDLKKADYLYSQWKHVAPTHMGGAALGNPDGDFEPGKYLKHGCVITSRGCPNKCWFCTVWKRNPEMKILPITEGWNLMDDNLLACPDDHIRSVFAMLKNQKHKSRFTGGLEAARLKGWHCELLSEIKPEYIYFAYDTEDDYEPLRQASTLLKEYGIMTGHRCMCYCLIGYPKDSFYKAQERITRVIKLGFMPFAMLWKDQDGNENREWRKFQRQWANPIITAVNMKSLNFSGFEKAESERGQILVFK